jgi:hypothetical protein
VDENKRWLKAEDSSDYVGIRIDYLRPFRGSSKATSYSHGAWQNGKAVQLIAEQSI